jgi:hypothetical protein
MCIRSSGGGVGLQVIPVGRTIPAGVGTGVGVATTTGFGVAVGFAVGVLSLDPQAPSAPAASAPAATAANDHERRDAIDILPCLRPSTYSSETIA